MKRSRPYVPRGAKSMKKVKYSDDGYGGDFVDDGDFSGFQDVPVGVGNINKEDFVAPEIIAHDGDPIDLTCLSSDDEPEENDEELCVYPDGDDNSVFIYQRDLKCLLNKDMLNDSLLDFYFRYLDRAILESPHRFYFFSTFFFPQYMKWGYEKIKRWTSHVDIFSYDYLFIPMNTNAHWRLMILCNPGKKRKPGEKMFILILDSLGHKTFKGRALLLKSFQKYLNEEWANKHPEEEKREWIFTSAAPDVPSQGNSYDCGLFIMKYAEAFCTGTPPELNDRNSVNRFFRSIYFSEDDIENHREEVHQIIKRLTSLHKLKKRSKKTEPSITAKEIENTEIEEMEVNTTVAKEISPVPIESMEIEEMEVNTTEEEISPIPMKNFETEENENNTTEEKESNPIPMENIETEKENNTTEEKESNPDTTEIPNQNKNEDGTTSDTPRKPIETNGNPTPNQENEISEPNQPDEDPPTPETKPTDTNQTETIESKPNPTQPNETTS
eukprot:TRINITY_DN3415_c0_g1_i1.p1 TRINITY_DN3415_c0_g1~~TRINITY_DN3415_c0_g1_i1.p1  ORF type:complete len:498 (-),score=130.67 TRINITY_DN3415_c0_g1_i1:54-1547(-)